METSNILQNRVPVDKTVSVPISISKTQVEAKNTCACCTVSAESNPTLPEGFKHAGEYVAGRTVLDVTEIAIPEESLTFKTNINCEGCRAKIAPILEAVNGIQKWEVDLHSPNKTLIVTGRGIFAEEIIKEVQNSGYLIETIISDK